MTPWGFAVIAAAIAIALSSDRIARRHKEAYELLRDQYGLLMDRHELRGKELQWAKANARAAEASALRAHAFLEAEVERASANVTRANQLQEEMDKRQASWKSHDDYLVKRSDRFDEVLGTLREIVDSN